MAASVLVAVGEVDHIISQVKDAAAALVLGRDMGALIDSHALRRLHLAIEKADQEGAKIILDGRAGKAPSGFEKGMWLAPTILDYVKPEMECVTNELFGPVLSIIRVRTLDEALELDKKSAYGNATSVFTTSGAVARVVSERSHSGMIGINIGVPVPREPFSFGGTKESKFGYGDITGSGGVEFWSNRKKITAKWAAQTDKNWMS
jgi:malonate-semialdehyde dehydrogenase (acetylating)/methylmalonate-semialdehyde dehydrogenase